MDEEELLQFQLGAKFAAPKTRRPKTAPGKCHVYRNDTRLYRDSASDRVTFDVNAA